nr:MAG TPA_asm: hypothetical protein [Caudoviricetes sp.]
MSLCENWSFCWYFSIFIDFGFKNICAFLGHFLRVYYPIFSQFIMYMCSYLELVFVEFLKNIFLLLKF